MFINVSALDWLVDFVNSFWESLKTLFLDALTWLVDNIVDALFWFLDNIYKFSIWFLEGIYVLLSFVIEGILTVIKVSFLWMFDGVLTLVYVFVRSLDLSGIAVNYFADWGLLSPQALYVVNQSGIPQGLTLLAYAIGIRVLLNLIPAAFTRI